MAGKRHHYLPQFLMRGFLAKGQWRGERTIVHHKDRGVSDPTAIDSIGLERNFYGDSSSTDLDENITRNESSAYGHTLNEIRSQGVTGKIERKEIASLIAHLIVRTKRARNAIAAGNEAFSNLFNLVSADERFAQKAYQTTLDQNSNLLENRIREKAHSKGIVISDVEIDEIVLLARSELSSNKAAYFLEAQEYLKNVAVAHESNLVDSKLTHLNILEQGLEPDNRVKHLMRFDWRVVAFKDPLILGDSPVIGFSEKQQDPYDLLLEQEYANAIVLPVNTTLAVVGTLGESVSLSTARINRGVAELARDFFICSTATNETKNLIQHIGSAPDLFTAEEVRSFFEKRLLE